MEQMMAAIRAGHEKTMAKLDANYKRIITKTDVLIEEMEPCVGKFEANTEKRYAVAQHLEVPKEGATVETFGALKKRYGDGHLATGSRRNGTSAIVGPGRSWPSSAEGCVGHNRNAIMA
jgi:hypothetical protein